MTRTNRIVVPSAADMIEIMKKVANGTDKIDLSNTFKPAHGTSSPSISYTNDDFDLFITFNVGMQINLTNGASILRIDSSPVASNYCNSSIIVTSWNGILPKGRTLTHYVDNARWVFGLSSTDTHAVVSYSNNLSYFFVHAYRI